MPVKVSAEIDLTAFLAMLESSVDRFELTIDNTFTMKNISMTVGSGEGDYVMYVIKSDDKQVLTIMKYGPSLHPSIFPDMFLCTYQSKEGAGIAAKFVKSISIVSVEAPDASNATEATTGGGKAVVTYNKKKYSVRTGSKGGKYIMVDGKKVYM